MGRLPPGSNPAERRWKRGCFSRAAGAVAPVGRPDEALVRVLGVKHGCGDRLQGEGLVQHRCRRSTPTSPWGSSALGTPGRSLSRNAIVGGTQGRVLNDGRNRAVALAGRRRVRPTRHRSLVLVDDCGTRLLPGRWHGVAALAARNRWWAAAARPVNWFPVRVSVCNDSLVALAEPLSTDLESRGPSLSIAIPFRGPDDVARSAK